jgi:hypothetical protein
MIVFFNGIRNTPEDAKDSLGALKALYGEIDGNGEKIKYELLYNPTLGFFDDVFEVLQQRSNEYNMFFFDLISGSGAWYEKAKTMTDFANLALFMEEFISSKERDITFSLINASPTAVDYAEHRVRLDTWMLEGKKLLFVAHSQGNLFANAAYDYAKSKVGEESVKVVHVAPASFKINGPHVLADKDHVISTLRLLTTNQLPEVTDSIPEYNKRPPGSNDRMDRLGHGFVEIYINTYFTTSQRVRQYIREALNSLVAPSAQAVSGFFTVTLTWDGAGDVDLHVDEPDRTHVYFANQQGRSGHLDVDNTNSYGPEHYYASCDANILQQGLYYVKIKNYARADDRVATIQLATKNNGVIGTLVRSLVGKGNDLIDVFYVTLFQEENGEYIVTMHE